MGRLNIAVVGSGISGVSCAWALSQRHDVTLFESESRAGGHAHTVDVKTDMGLVSVDTGFIVFNDWTYPNFAALMDYLAQPVVATQMSFSVSADQGRCEYSGDSLATLMGLPRQWISPQHWKMMLDLLRFYRRAQSDAATVAVGTSLGEYLSSFGYGESFVHRHILPMSAAIWSASPAQIAAYPFHAFVDFFANHRLFALGQRPAWSTVQGGSRAYVSKLIEDSRFSLKLNSAVLRVTRLTNGVEITLANGERCVFDHVVLGTHADESLRLISNPSDEERDLLSVFQTSANTVYLHRDPQFMPSAKRFWSAWNYRVAEDNASTAPNVTYWMNRLQDLKSPEQHFVSLNPIQKPERSLVDGTFHYRHPVFNNHTLAAQHELWQLQGKNRLWFCGAWFGAGFHEDGLQAGLSVAEQLGGVRRPWRVDHESSRIRLKPSTILTQSNLVDAAE